VTILRVESVINPMLPSLRAATAFADSEFTNDAGEWRYALR